MRAKFASHIAIAAGALLVACSIPETRFVPSGADAAPDASTDPTADARVDGGADSDAPPPECDPSDPCCDDDGFLLGTDHACETTTEHQCEAACGGQPQQRTVERFCTGTTATCDGEPVAGAWEDLGATCGGGQVCQERQGAAPVCQSCDFGCGGGTCREGVLWTFETIGGTVANAFGGTDVPPNPRGGADGRCLVAYNERHTARQCNPANVHAILHVNGTDSLAGMAGRFGIPTSIPVRRAADQAPVAANWAALLNPGASGLTNPATTAASEAEGIFWSGANTADHCRNWTSAVSTDVGTRGYGTITSTNWLSRDSFRCDRTARLLCVCWAGGD
jgi:hypothetical protein